MHCRTAGLYAVLLMAVIAPCASAEKPPALPLGVTVSHVDKDSWRVDYSFSAPVTEVRLPAVSNFREQSWKILTPHLRLKTDGDTDIIGAGGKPFKAMSIVIRTFNGAVQKAYAPFNGFTDGGTAIFLGHLQGDARRGKKAYVMSTDIELKGLGQENVIAPPHNKQVPGGARGYAYFGPAQPVRSGSTRFLIDPQTPAWARETMLDAGARIAAYYEKAYQRPLKDELFILASLIGLESPGLSLNGGAVMGQLAYRFDGKQMVGDHPKKREMLSRIVAHEMAHLWQMNLDRGGVGDDDPWIHEGGAEAMALDGLLKTGLLSAQQVDAYRMAQTAMCDKLGQSVASYEGIYACGLVRFDKLGSDIVPLWRSLMHTSESTGEVYSSRMIEAISRGKDGTAAPAKAAGPAAAAAPP